MPIYGYARVSTQIQADDGESLGVQQRQLAGWAMMRGEDIAETFVERAVSGSIHVTDRPEGGRLWSLLKRGDTVVAARLDRLFRSALDALQTVEQARRDGVSIHIIEGLGEITGNGMAKAFLTISAAFAELERDTIRERIATTKADQRARGRYLGGKVPYGFVVDPDGFLEPVEAQQAIIRRVLEIRTEIPTGRSLRFIRDEIEREHGERIGLDALARIVKEGTRAG